LVRRIVERDRIGLLERIEKNENLSEELSVTLEFIIAMRDLHIEKLFEFIGFAFKDRFSQPTIMEIY